VTKAILGLFLFIVVGCATGGGVSITTSPDGGDLRVMNGTKMASESLGKSPYRVQKSELRLRAKGDGPVQIEISKPGFMSKVVVITDLAGSADINIQLGLQPIEDIVSADDSNATIDALFESQRMAKVGRYDEALRRLEALQVKEPKLAAIYELQGGIYYLREDLPRALDAYQMAVRYNPKNNESLTMKRYIEQKLKLTKPTASTSEGQQ